MSWKLTGIVSTRVCGGVVRKMVLLRLASYANDDGTGVFASFQTMGDECEIDRKTAKRVLQAFEVEGLAVKVGTRECANGWTNEYALDVAAIERLPALTRGKQTRGTAPPVHDAPGADSPAPGAQRPPTRGTAPPKPVRETKEDTSPSLRSGDGVRTPRKRAAAETTLLTAPSPSMLAYAEDQGFTQGRATQLFEAWRDYHISKATVIADPNASFRTWVRNEIKFHGRPGHVPSTATEQRPLFGVAAQNARFNDRSNRGALAALRGFGDVVEGGGEASAAGDPDEGFPERRGLGHS